MWQYGERLKVVPLGDKPHAMQCRSSFALAALLFASLSFTACSNQDGAGGTVDGTDEDNYQLNQGADAPPMKGEAAATPDTAAAVVADSAATKAVK